jgi:hypothetical protein
MPRIIHYAKLSPSTSQLHNQKPKAGQTRFPRSLYCWLSNYSQQHHQGIALKFTEKAKNEKWFRDDRDTTQNVCITQHDESNNVFELQYTFLDKSNSLYQDAIAKCHDTDFCTSYTSYCSVFCCPILFGPPKHTHYVQRVSPHQGGEISTRGVESNQHNKTPCAISAESADVTYLDLEWSSTYMIAAMRSFTIASVSWCVNTVLTVLAKSALSAFRGEITGRRLILAMLILNIDSTRIQNDCRPS